MRRTRTPFHPPGGGVVRLACPPQRTSTKGRPHSAERCRLRDLWRPGQRLRDAHPAEAGWVREVVRPFSFRHRAASQSLMEGAKRGTSPFSFRYWAFPSLLIYPPDPFEVVGVVQMFLRKFRFFAKNNLYAKPRRPTQSRPARRGPAP